MGVQQAFISYLLAIGLLLDTVYLAYCLVPPSPCENTLDDSFGECKPCTKDKWDYMISPSNVEPASPPPLAAKCSDRMFFKKGEKCDGQEITDKNDPDGCYNNDPLAIPTSVEPPEMVAQGEVELDPYKSAIGFSIPDQPFFRFFLPPGQRSTPYKFDIGSVGKYYVRKTATAADGKTFDTDFELFEWPGKTGEDFKAFLETVTQNSYGCRDDEVVITVEDQVRCKLPHVFIMLAFDRKSTKFLNYPCNSERGTHVVAYGRSDQDGEKSNLDDINGEPTQKIYLSYGVRSMHKEYIQPLYVRNVTLLELQATDPKETTCQKNNFGDLRTVHDFTFATERLIMGMKCGIIVVSKIMDKSFFTAAAKLSYSGERVTHFPQPINIISGSVCCSNALDCGTEGSMIAAYSYDSKRQPTDLKYMYVSFDLGSTFEKKLIAPASSLINLIQSLYGVYERWALYYKILETNDADSVLNFKELDQFKHFDEWETLNSDEKEMFIQQHAPGIGAERTKNGKRILRRAFCDKVTEVMNTKGYEKHLEDFVPEWVKKSIVSRYEEFEDSNGKKIQNHDECEKVPKCKEAFEEDHIVKEIMKDYKGTPVDPASANCPKDAIYWKDKTKVYTRKQNPDEGYCLEIVSFEVITEEKSVLLLCKVGYCQPVSGGPADCSTVPGGVADLDGYAVFEANLNPRVPVVFPKRQSKRILKCKPIKASDKAKETIPPVLLRVPKSSSLFILNCDQVVYFSGNGGKNIFNVVFYMKNQDVKQPNANVTYVRKYHLPSLTVAPSAAMDVNGHSFVMTFGNLYAYGILNYNRELRLLVGEAFKKEKDSLVDKSKSTIAIPWFTNSGQCAISLVLLEILTKEPEYLAYYKSRPAIRLVEIPLNIYKEIVPFFGENKNILPAAREKEREFADCNTYSFTIKPRSAKLDIGDSVVVQIEVTDVHHLLPLGIFTNEEQSLLVKAELSNRSRGHPKEIIKHDWDVTITSLQHFKPEEEAMLDAFFGAQYTRLYEYSTNVVLVNLPTVRCHVQPSGAVVTEIGCLGKIMVAHEDEFRPQCQSTFVNNFEYILTKDQYDQELARYWIENNPEFVQRQKNGELKIIYDYTTFGCPLQPYSSDPFVPDLRILSDKNRRNSTLGVPYNGSYILIEIFGATGFNYTWTLGNSKCKTVPQSRKTMVRDWIIRRRLFNITRGKMKSWLNEDEKMPDDGNHIFDGSGVNEHLNIWNRVNFQQCDQSDSGKQYQFSDDESKQEYEIMQNSNTDGGDASDGLPNSLTWAEKARPKVFIFLAIAVGNDGTLCNFYTLFGVSLPKAQELDDLWSFICFLAFSLLWILLVVIGYWCRKSYIRKAYIYEARSERLKQAAWSVIYRYEKLLHENENKELESEITDFSRAIYQKEREKGYEHMKSNEPPAAGDKSAPPKSNEPPPAGDKSAPPKSNEPPPAGDKSAPVKSNEPPRKSK